MIVRCKFCRKTKWSSDICNNPQCPRKGMATKAAKQCRTEPSAHTLLWGESRVFTYLAV
jgi:hypothetical protein